MICQDKTYDIVLVIFLKLLDIGVDQWLLVPSLDTKLLEASEIGCGQENIFN